MVVDFLSKNVFDKANWNTNVIFNWHTCRRKGKTKEKLNVYLNES